jgi:hypothetical protein
METIFRHLRYLYANMLQVTIMQKDRIICNGMNFQVEIHDKKIGSKSLA